MLTVTLSVARGSPNENRSLTLSRPIVALIRGSRSMSSNRRRRLLAWILDGERTRSASAATASSNHLFPLKSPPSKRLSDTLKLGHQMCTRCENSGSLEADK